VLGRAENSVYTEAVQSLLTDTDPPAFRVSRPEGSSPFLLTADHAGRVLPQALGSLGLPESELSRHIAWDIGIAEVARRLSETLDAVLVAQTYSRLVIDANRPPGTPQSIMTLSEATRIPGNEALTPADAQRREREIFRPYHDRIVQELDQRRATGRPAVLVSLHSFTPVFHGQVRPWHVGVLYNRDPRLGHALLHLLREEPGLVVGDNEPYAVDDETDYTIVNHGERRALAHVEIEIRQDLITEAAGQTEWAARFGRLLELAGSRY
jgi:predicted N-formylglutamate amidohydrolase